MPPTARVGAALALLADTAGDGDLEVVYTRRRDDLFHHPGQVSLPGGRREPGETSAQAAVREAVEEVALDGASVTVLGMLPALYIPPSRFWLQTVVARWDAPHPLVAAEAEVAEVLTVRASTLCDPAVWRVVHLSAGGWSWAWQLDDRHLLWGATAQATVALLDLLEPGWRGDTAPASLAPEREVRPWRGPDGQSRSRRAACLPGLPEVGAGTAAPDGIGLAAAGLAVAAAVRRWDGAPERVLVLAGGGGSGAVGRQAARLLRGGGVDARVVTSARSRGLGGSAGLVVDALVGTGLRGPLRSPALDVLEALRARTEPILSVDLPTGLHPVHGLVGPCVAADATLALGRVHPGLLAEGLAPFVGDLYRADASGGLARVVIEPGDGWRE